MTQPGHALEQRGTNPGGMHDTKGKGDSPSPISICVPSPPASLLAPLPVRSLVFLWAPSSWAGGKADGGPLVPPD